MHILVSKLKHMAEQSHRPIFMGINLWENGTLLIFSKSLQVPLLILYIREEHLKYPIDHHGEIIQVIMYSVEINLLEQEE